MKYRAMSSVLLLILASAFPVSAQFQTPYSPWEASVAVQATRADLPGIPNTINALSPPSPIPTGSLVNVIGGELTVQQNFAESFSGEALLSGGFAGLTATVPFGDKQAVGETTVNFNPQLYFGGYGIVVTFRQSEKHQPWFRVVPGYAHADLNPDSILMKSALAANDQLKFSSHTFALQAGVGVDLLVKPKLAIRASVDEISTWLFQSQQNQWHASLGISWRFGRGNHDDY